MSTRKLIFIIAVLAIASAIIFHLMNNGPTNDKKVEIETNLAGQDDASWASYESKDTHERTQGDNVIDKVHKPALDELHSISKPLT